VSIRRWRSGKQWVAGMIVELVRPWSVDQRFRMYHLRIEGIVGAVTTGHTWRIGWTMVERRRRMRQRSLVMVLGVMIEVSFVVRTDTD